MKKILPLSFCMLTLASFAFVVTTPAEEGSGGKGPSKAMLKKYDSNHDGVISADEKAAGQARAKAARDTRRQANLAKYDENKDGKINKGERAKIKADRAAKRAAMKARKAVMKAERKAKHAKKKAMKASK